MPKRSSKAVREKQKKKRSSRPCKEVSVASSSAVGDKSDDSLLCVSLSDDEDIGASLSKSSLNIPVMSLDKKTGKEALRERYESVDVEFANSSSDDEEIDQARLQHNGRGIKKLRRCQELLDRLRLLHNEAQDAEESYASSVPQMDLHRESAERKIALVRRLVGDLTSSDFPVTL